MKPHTLVAILSMAAVTFALAVPNSPDQADEMKKILATNNSPDCSRQPCDADTAARQVGLKTFLFLVLSWLGGKSSLYGPGLLPPPGMGGPPPAWTPGESAFAHGPPADGDGGSEE